MSYNRVIRVFKKTTKNYKLIKSKFPSKWLISMITDLTKFDTILSKVFQIKVGEVKMLPYSVEKENTHRHFLS